MLPLADTDALPPGGIEETSCRSMTPDAQMSKEPSAHCCMSDVVENVMSGFVLTRSVPVVIADWELLVMLTVREYVDDPAEPMMGVCEEIDMLTLWSAEGSSAYAIPSCAPTEGGRTVSVPSVAMNITRARQLITAVNGRSLRFIVEIFAFWRT